MNTIASRLRIENVRHELRRREVEVMKVDQISPGFVAVTFGGESLEDFVSRSFDDHVKFLFSGENGEIVARHYTPRHFDPVARELTIEFGLHGSGPGAQWAKNAAPGWRAVIGGPKGSLIIPKDCDWHFLIGDATALPAIHRRLEELPAGSQAVVRVQVNDERDRRKFDVLASVDARWAATPEELVAEVRSTLLPAGSGFTWGAGEAALMRRLKDVLWTEKGIDRETARLGAYWKKGNSDFHESLARPSVAAA